MSPDPANQISHSAAGRVRPDGSELEPIPVDGRQILVRPGEEEALAEVRAGVEHREHLLARLDALGDDAGALHHVGVTSSFTAVRRRQLAQELAHLRKNALDGHPWRDGAAGGAEGSVRMPGGTSRWSQGKDLSWEPLRIDRVGEVRYDHLQGDRFRHAATFVRWRPDRRPVDCRYDQLEVTPPVELAEIFGAQG